MAQSSTVAHHDSNVQHHFVDAGQQFDSAKLGMWVFLVTEILFFGGLFAAYIIFRVMYHDMFVEASVELDTLMGGINTAVLICSSLSFALAIHFIQLNQQKKTIIALVITLLLAATFMVIKYFEWTHKFHLGIYPGKFYNFDGIDDPHVAIFFSLYYLMTGLHGLHVLIGMGIIIWLIVKTAKGRFNDEYFNPIEIAGLYWHLVDIIWIFLFPLFYLID